MTAKARANTAAPVTWWLQEPGCCCEQQPLGTGGPLREAGEGRRYARAQRGQAKRPCTFTLQSISQTPRDKLPESKLQQIYENEMGTLSTEIITVIFIEILTSRNAFPKT